jgi:hypothetical protein
MLSSQNTPNILDPNRPLSWDELLRLPGNNILKNLYYANQRWEALKAHAAVTLQHQANLEEQASLETTEPSRPARSDKVDIFSDGREAEEVLLEMGIDPSSGPLEELAEEARAKRAIELIYTPDEKAYSLLDELLSALTRGLNMISFQQALRTPVDPTQAAAQRSLKEKLLEDLYRQRPDLAMQNWILAANFVDRLANALINLGYTADTYAAAFATSPDGSRAFVLDFEKHVAHMSQLSHEARRAVDASRAPEISPNVFPSPQTFRLPPKQEGQSNQEWRYEIALEYIQKMWPHVTTERTTPAEQQNQLQAQQQRSTPFKLKPEAPAPEPSAQEKLEYIAKDVLQIDLETLVSRAVYGAMHTLGIPGMGPEQDEEAKKKKAPSPFEPPNPFGDKTK